MLGPPQKRSRRHQGCATTRLSHRCRETLNFLNLGRPCKIVDMSTSKTGKHGHAKVHLVAIDIFTGKKLEDICPSTHNMDVPNVSRNEYQLVNIDDGFLNLMNQDGVSKDDVKVPDSDLGKQINDDFDDGKDLLVTIISAMGEEQAISYKEAPKGS
ncbi:hypothetical protein HGRIS_006599 [Hohenbuehelia grisea]|uniref:Eukaryotic translation initiation factor 5A n=1 Tax=Hohenbuehelia grisea TaxID=104357 RepID=A0ABR3JA32_9AGAR